MYCIYVRHLNKCDEVVLLVNLKRGSGGIAVPDKKELSSSAKIVDAGLPNELVLFLSQHIGAPASALVKPGDVVKRGQMVASAQGAVSAAVHAPTSGKVKAVEARYHPIQGRLSQAVILEPDGLNETHESVRPRASAVEDISREDLLELSREIGLVGLGGAAFPTAVKLTPPPVKPIDTYLLNGIECEPYLTADDRLMVENPYDVVFGFRALMKAAGVNRGIVCIEDNKPDAIQAIQEAIGAFQELELAVVPSRYPRGGEKQLIEVVLGREVPPPPGLPLDVGVVVSNVGTAYTLAQAVLKGLPLVERIVTVTGEGINTPQNFRALVGTPISYLVELAGGFSGPVGKVIMGGPMMGTSIKDLNGCIVKGTSGLVVLNKSQARQERVLPCVRCGRCVEACPIRLLPVWIAACSDSGYLEEAEKYRAMDCIECGACAYECPSKRPLVQSIKLAKSRITARRRALAAKNQ